MTKEHPNQHDHLSLADRFWSKVDKRGPDECWPWTGAKDGCGYGRINIDGKPRMATHVALQLAGRPITPGMKALHKCDDPGCTNEGHLFEGTQSGNIHDMITKGRAVYVRGSAQGLTNLTDDNVREMHKLYAEGSTQVDLAKQFNTTQPTVSKILLGQTWAHLYPGTPPIPVKRSTKGQKRTKESGRLSSEDVQKIRELYATDEYTQKQLAARYGVTQAQISNIVLLKQQATIT